MRRLPRSRPMLGAAALALAALLAPWTAPAQEPVLEEQVPLDEAGAVLSLDARLARELGLFTEYRDLREVLLFRSARGHVLEITSRRGGRLHRERRPLGEAEVAELRRDVSARLAARAPERLLDQEGRYLLLAMSTAAGVGFYGWAVPVIFDVDDTRGQVALYMLVASASFFGPWAWSAGRPVTYGMANAAFWGGSRGIVHGIGLHRVLDGPAPEPWVVCPPTDPVCLEDQEEEREAWQRRRLAAGMAGSLAEGIGGLVWARGARATAGDVHLAGTVSDFGTGWGAGLGVIANVEDAGVRWALALGGAAAGLGTGLWLRERRDPSWGDAEVFRTAGLLGAYGGIVVADLTGSDEDELFAALAMAGNAAGLVFGDRLVRGRALTPGQAVLVDLGTVAGGLLGVGLAVLMTDAEGSDPTPHLLLSAAGAAAGFGITFASLAPRARGGPADPRPDRGRDGPDPGSLDRLQLELAPAVGARRGGNDRLPPLRIGVRYRFGGGR